MQNKLASSGDPIYATFVIEPMHSRPAQRGLQETMKKLLAIIALIIVTGALALAPAANAARRQRSNSTGQGEACTYAGYPCSQWNQMRDRW